ncbi:hypothetical protein F4782DRAFT_477507 [Xylaria castorea]|nr:hypothetical protein F4782DRAFT_477507 [Xylaria castorea]
MAKLSKRVIAYQGDVSQLQVGIENEGWSTLKPVLSFSSRSSRTHLPRPSLRLPRKLAMKADIDAPNDVNFKIYRPTFDLGLGCFGHLVKVTDYHLIETVKELRHGNDVCTDEEWIGFRPGGSCEDEEDCSTDALDEGGYHDSVSRISGGQDLLKELDDLEAARPKPGKRQVVIPGNRAGIWEKLEFGASKLSFDSWVDEIAALEASSSMPKGTRYYKVNDLGDSAI